MSNKVDKLFKEKLEDHSLQPSAQAWEKVEAHLEKKNKMVLWVRIAAAVAGIGLLSFVALEWNAKEPKTEVATKEIKKEAAPAIEKQKEEQPKQVQQQPKRTQPKVVVTPVVEEPPVQDQLAVVPEPEVVEEPGPELTTNNSQPTTKKGITLTYSLPSIKKQEAPAEPTVAEQKTEPKKSGFERVIEIAKEVKNSDNPLGELRQAKDDIFALDFKKDKDKKKQ